MNPIFVFKQPTLNSGNSNVGMIVFSILILILIGFFVFKILSGSFQARPINKVGVAIGGTLALVTLSSLAVAFIARYGPTPGQQIALYENGIQFADSHEIIPLQNISMEFGLGLAPGRAWPDSPYERLVIKLYNGEGTALLNGVQKLLNRLNYANAYTVVVVFAKGSTEADQAKILEQRFSELKAKQKHR